jgi:hypothetical protein
MTLWVENQLAVHPDMVPDMVQFKVSQDIENIPLSTFAPLKAMRRMDIAAYGTAKGKAAVEYQQKDEQVGGCETGPDKVCGAWWGGIKTVSIQRHPNDGIIIPPEPCTSCPGIPAGTLGRWASPSLPPSLM